MEPVLSMDLAARLEAAVNSDETRSIIKAEIEKIAAEKVNVTVGSLLNQMLTGKELGAKINKKIDAEFPAALDTATRARAANFVSQVDIGNLVSARIEDFVENRIVKAKIESAIIPASAINWKGAVVPGRVIDGKIDNFVSGGIRDQAEKTVLSVREGRIVVNGDVVADGLKIVQGATLNNLNVTGNITVEGRVKFNHPSFSNSVKSIVDDRMDAWAKRDKLDLNGGGIFSNGVALLEDGALGSSVMNSNLRSVGRLIKLDVSGETSIADTLNVIKSRVGINTDQPAGALTVWDEEAELTIRKLKSRTMFVGSSRDCNISIGVGGNPVLDITPAGASMAQVTIGGITISTAIEAPMTTGTPGDLCINSRPDLSPAWAWRCLGGNRWAELK